MNIYILNSRNGATVNDRGLKVSDLYGRQKPVSPFSTSSLNCWTQSRKATMAWSNLLSQKNLRPPEQYKGSSCTKHQTEGKGRIESPEECVNGDVGRCVTCITLDLSVSDSKYEWFPYGTRRYLKREVLFELHFNRNTMVKRTTRY